MKTKYFLLALLFSTVTFAQVAAEYEYTFTFTDEFNNTEELILGKDPFGTDGLDTLFGERVVPPVPAGEFGARFLLPEDTTLTMKKDIRFGCYWAIGHQHFVDLSYTFNSDSIFVEWEWDSLLSFGIYDVAFLNRDNSHLLGIVSWFSDSARFDFPSSINKIIIEAIYNGTLSYAQYDLNFPIGGEVFLQGETYTISWWSNHLAPTLDIELSIDGGDTWSYIVKDLPDNHTTYEWTTPMINSNNCLIRLGGYPCSYDVSDSIFTITFASSVDEVNLPKEFSLEQNYPNPFNPRTKIRFEIPEVIASGMKQSLHITIKVYNILGNEVASLVNDHKPAGNYEIEFNGSELPSGVYFYELRAGSYIETRKMLLIK